LLSLRESCLHEMCTGSLGGGRRPARERASSDPRIARIGSAEITSGLSARKLIWRLRSTNGAIERYSGIAGQRRHYVRSRRLIGLTYGMDANIFGRMIY